MAILFIEGFEHNTAGSLLTGWGSGPQTVVANPAGAGAFGSYSGQFNATSGFRYASFRRNQSAGRPVRARLCHMNFNYFVNNASRSNPLIFGDTAGGVQSTGFRTSGNQFVLTRGLTQLAAVAATDFSFSTFYPFKMSVFIDNSAGSADLYRAENSSPVLSVSGVDTQGGSNNYADLWGVTTQNFNSLINIDDIVVYAPSILLDVGSGAVSSGDNLTIGGTATVTVSDVDTSPDASNHTVSGTLVRVWVHNWNDVGFSDGDAVTGGTLSGTTVVAPDASFSGGFEPYSWPQYEAVVGRYVTRQQWTANGTVQLTPTGSAVNVENIDNIPLNTSAYNEATSGSNETDVYTTAAALPAGVAAIRGVQVRVSGQSFGTYTTVESVLTDASGSNTLSGSLSATAEVQLLHIAELNASGAAWGLSGPTQGSYTLGV